jgi:cobalamin-dependent methionine synthase I
MLVAADNLSAARPSVRRALEERDAEFVARLCRRAEAAGAGWLDLNPGHLPRPRREGVWEWLVGTAERACGLTLMLDAAQPESLELALGFCTRPAVLNMATAEPGRLEPVLELAAAHPETTVVAATMTATVPRGAEERLSLASLIVEQAARQGVEASRLVLDPMVMPLALAGGEAHAKAVLEFLRAAPQLFDPAPRTLAAVSNLITSSAGQDARFAAGPFLAAAFGAGLDIAMADALDSGLMGVVRLCRVFAGRSVFAPAEHAGG